MKHTVAYMDHTLLYASCVVVRNMWDASRVISCWWNYWPGRWTTFLIKVLVVARCKFVVQIVTKQTWHRTFCGKKPTLHVTGDLSFCILIYWFPSCSSVKVNRRASTIITQILCEASGVQREFPFKYYFPFPYLTGVCLQNADGVVVISTLFSNPWTYRPVFLCFPPDFPDLRVNPVTLKQWCVFPLQLLYVPVWFSPFWCADRGRASHLQNIPIPPDLFILCRSCLQKTFQGKWWNMKEKDRKYRMKRRM